VQARRLNGARDGHSVSLDRATPNNSADAVWLKWTDDRARVQNIRWIEGAFDPAHRRDAACVAVLLQKMLLESADAVFRAEGAAEGCSRVVELQRQAAFDLAGELDPVGIRRNQNVVVQIAVTDMTIDGELEIGAICAYLRASNVQKTLNAGERHGDVVLHRSL